MKKILIITYYWPPSGGGGVQRWLKFVKYLPAFGWSPVVVVPESPEYPAKDSSLESDIPPGIEIIRLPIWEPYGIFKKLTGRKKEERVNNGLLFDDRKQTLIEKISLWIRGNCLIPDPRVFWVRPSVKRLKKIVPSLDISLVITTGPPHSVHLIGYQLKKYFGIPWIADLRDPWSTFDQLEKFYTSKIALSRHQKLEKKVLTEANRIITVSSAWAIELSQNIGKPVECITNGFDNDDVCPSIKTTDEEFILSHIGTLNSYRNRSILWEALNEICLESAPFRNRIKIQIVGIYNGRLKEELSHYPAMVGNLIFSGYIPHNEVKFKYAESGCLLLLQNQTRNALGHIPGKVFEYLASGRPILAIADPESDIARIIEECNAGYICDFNDKTTLKKAILNLFNKRFEGSDNQKIEMYSRFSLTEKLSKVIQQVIDNP